MQKPSDLPGSARARTLRHLTSLAAGVATASAACHDSSYNVVDPMPTPARCAGSAALFTATLTPKDEHTFSITLTAPQGRPDLQLGKVGDVQGAHPNVFTPTPDGGVLEITADANAQSIEGVIELGCGAPPLGSLGFDITIGDAGPPTIRLFDR